MFDQIVEMNKLRLNMGRNLQNKAKVAITGVADVEKSPPESYYNSANNVNFIRNCPDFWPNQFLPNFNCHISASTSLILLKFALISMSKYAC